jgi:hypothetical protein
VNVFRSGEHWLCVCQGDEMPHPPALCTGIRRDAAPKEPPGPPPGTGLEPGWAARQAAQADPHKIIEK